MASPDDLARESFTGAFLPDANAVLIGSAVTVIRTLSAAFLCLAWLICLLVMCGWLGNVEMLKHLLYNQVTGFATVFWFFIVTTAAAPTILNITGFSDNKIVKICSRTVLGLTLLVGLILWFEHLFGQDWGTAIEIFQPPGDAGKLTLPGATPVDVSFCIVLTSIIALALDFFGKKMPLLYQGLSLLLALPSFFLVLACVFGVGDAVDVFCAYQGCVRFKYLNYTILFCLATAVFLSRPDQGMTSFFAVNTMGGRQVRTASIGAAAMIPVAWILVSAKRNEIINEPTALVLGMIIFLLTVGMVVAYGARKIDKIDMEKQATEQSLSELAAYTDTQFSYKMVCLECGKEFSDGYLACIYDGSELSRVLDKLAPGSIFGEKYEIAEALGSGGMSTVYKAKHLFLDKTVAIKLLNQQLASDAKAVQRFQVEAKAAFGLEHSNLLGVYDFGVSRDGQAYIVMDYLQGESLSDIIRRENSVSVVRALPIFLDVCKGLSYAHEHGILHRDIKPSNVMLVKDEYNSQVAKIVDFGLAKVYDPEAMKLTQTGDIFGSPLYMSPEQCRGLTLDDRSDLYSLGVLMYETLTGRAPIVGTSVYDTFAKKLTDTPAPFDPDLQIPEWLSKLVFCLLRTEPSERPASAKVLITTMNQYIRGA
ncbi:MAG: serine/threonine protein kinase [Cyanobacteria bacterium SZAS TMP-1]|nr:serine/threonine protein kinase [Cyanobacteria bacterium SZAS TMP-1]